MTEAENPLATKLARLIADRKARVAIIGLGYVGLPLALTLCRAGFPVLGFDIDERRVALLNRGESGIRHIPADAIRAALAEDRFEASADFERLGEADAILICVPTPLTRQREPDLSFVERASRQIARTLRPGQLVVLESTTWPGTTEEIVKPILEEAGARSGDGFFLAFSPEREDPGNRDFGTRDIPKIVGGDGAHASRLADALYAAAMTSTVPVSSPAVAEAVKLTENIFRSVNIALVNELKVVYDAMGIDVWDVIAAASTKPFGFMPFQPGPGLGGHCIPIDPFYLAWKAREFEVPTRFIELAGEINTAMPRHVVDRMAEALDRRFGRGLNGSRILVLGVAYKRNVEDTRESASFRLIELLEDRGAHTSYHDPHVPEIGPTREHRELAGRRSIALTAQAIADFDAVLVATDHDDVDYALVAAHMRLGVDTRNVFAKRQLDLSRVVKA
ncbi:nucleotide sugar dehydrogenase [Aureimonas phyllosphaerae]|uniref:UDP-N-acetyl-D-glucosamine dehydrogenase n=1 Tax=Aureimonas phyllosphaerae TaxID=1166078 RepID=A0A7W6BLK5_9HYPH|nr:nucleotide sugar dehydrogenase [Aureimonas phyllosphaerae]MBB3934116.1 UDP-N-acetyl-D-glucosamine dehydrogenase [Aureimonas phyllosphaerae]MBB3958668.1 UDP-N-acetyl-D-glucosamine dehydrogenase [Aureimonas phyllosphaerae]SFF17687.1 UDP-N-acetyl-D-glucosamine dehydrogenase [Aureimonas phyllosphaerae]